MPANLAEKEFEYRPSQPDPDYLAALSVFATHRTKDGRDPLTTAQKRKKRSLSMLNLNPDMIALKSLRQCRLYMKKEFGVTYDGFHNAFKKNYDNFKMCRCLAFMEVVTSVFIRRGVEMDMILSNHDKKTQKVWHAIRDLGDFDADAYEEGRDEAYRLLVLSLPQTSKFRLLSGAEELA